MGLFRRRAPTADPAPASSTQSTQSRRFRPTMPSLRRSTASEMADRAKRAQEKEISNQAWWGRKRDTYNKGARQGVARVARVLDVKSKLSRAGVPEYRPPPAKEPPTLRAFSTSAHYQFNKGYTLYVVSDLEGANLFNFSPIDKVPNKDLTKEDIKLDNIENINVLLKDTDSKLSEEDKNMFKDNYTTQQSALLGNSKKVKKEVVDEMNNFLLTDGMIDDIKNSKNSTTCIAFTGDLVDNRPHSIRILEKIVKLKERYPSRVILVGGNRDFNKLRLGIELFLIRNDEIDKIDKSPVFNIENLNPTLSDLLQNNYKFAQNNFNDLNYFHETNWGKNYKDYVSDTDNSFNRFEAILDITMNAKSEAYITEIKQLFPSVINTFKKEDLKNKLNLLGCLLMMAMCFYWREDVLPQEFKKYNGLFRKYFEYMHPMATFEINEKKGVLSHSGVSNIDKVNIPLGIQKIQAGGDGTPVADAADAAAKIQSLPFFVNQLTKDKNKMLVEYDNLKYSTKIPESVTRYIQVSAPPKQDFGPVSWWEGKESQEFTSKKFAWGNPRDLTNSDL